MPAPSSRMPASCCSTSRSPISTTSCARNCAPNCRGSLPQSGAIFVYATTEPPRRCCSAATRRRCRKAASPSSGRRSTSIRQPVDLVTARTFADPPLNTIVLPRRAAAFLLDGGGRAAGAGASRRALPTAPMTIGFQPHHLSPRTPQTRRPCAAAARRSRSPRSPARKASSISTSPASRWVMLTHGIHDIEPDTEIEVFHRHRAHLMVFDANGRAVIAHDAGGVGESDMARIDSRPHPPRLRPNPKSEADYALKRSRPRLRATAAPMRCSARPAAARPRCSTSSPACCTPRTGASCSTAATSPICRRRSATSRRCSSSRSSTTR